MAVVDTCAVVAAVDDRLPALGKRVGVDRLNISRHLDLHRLAAGHDPDADNEHAPWHFKLLMALLVYLTRRLFHIFFG